MSATIRERYRGWNIEVSRTPSGLWTFAAEAKLRITTARGFDTPRAAMAAAKRAIDDGDRYVGVQYGSMNNDWGKYPLTGNARKEVETLLADARRADEVDSGELAAELRARARAIAASKAPKMSKIARSRYGDATPKGKPRREGRASQKASVRSPFSRYGSSVAKPVRWAKSRDGAFYRATVRANGARLELNVNDLRGKSIGWSVDNGSVLLGNGEVEVKGDRKLAVDEAKRKAEALAGA